ncbi:MFS transporter [Actinocatenispora rupis]|uniref:MFS transporter n=1 Tax=Actinocatenispora rupis TaxID=519421 RepID=A0A8J3J3C4_9ACTN|nr:MFS transporter [Actinocatenispora rupis]GID10846.1 MFS transporter [Actinocatenispora rupis]
MLLPAILSAMFLYGFDLNVVNVALPTLAGQLHAGPAALQLVVGGYTFTYAAGLVTGGRLGDLYGHRRMFLAGMAAFAVASALCGLAQTPGQLVATRLVQGLTAAAMVPQVLAMITTAFPAAERPRALAGYGVVAAVSGICGQVLGGMLLSADVFGLGWRAVFLVNVPAAAIVLAVAPRVLPRHEPTTRVRLDLAGALALSATLGLALVPLVLGRDLGWPWWVWTLLAASVPVAVGTVWWERRVTAPLLDLALFTDRRYRLGIAVAAAFMATFSGVVFVTTLLLQRGLGLSAVQSGLAFAPMAVVGVLVPPLGRRLVTRHGPVPVVLLGCAVNAVAFGALGLALQLRGGAVGAGWLVVPLAGLGLGNTLLLPALLGATLAGVRPDRAGVAAGVLATAQQFAGTAGLAVLGTAFFAVLAAHHATPTGYARGAELVVWSALGLTAAMAGLTVRLRAVAAPAPGTAPVVAAVSSRR